MTSIPSLGNYAGWARRFAETCRQKQSSVAEVIPEVQAYAQEVQEECAREVARWGADPSVLRQRSALATASIAGWRSQAALEFGSGVTLGEPRLEAFLARLFRDVRAHQIRDAIREADHQANNAYRRRDEDQLARWRDSETGLRALLAAAELDPAADRLDWIKAVGALTNQIEAWASQKGWNVATKQLERSEESLGKYEVRMLTIHTEHGPVIVEPIARVVMGATGRVDVYAYPTLFRVMLLRSARNGEWRIRTDSGVFLRQEWSKETFFDVVQDLTTAS